jgi:hypothetical protein
MYQIVPHPQPWMLRTQVRQTPELDVGEFLTKEALVGRFELDWEFLDGILEIIQCCRP